MTNRDDHTADIRRETPFDLNNPEDVEEWILLDDEEKMAGIFIWWLIDYVLDEETRYPWQLGRVVVDFIDHVGGRDYNFPEATQWTIEVAVIALKSFESEELTAEILFDAYHALRFVDWTNLSLPWAQSMALRAAEKAAEANNRDLLVEIIEESNMYDDVRKAAIRLMDEHPTMTSYEG